MFVYSSEEIAHEAKRWKQPKGNLEEKRFRKSLDLRHVSRLDSFKYAMNNSSQIPFKIYSSLPVLEAGFSRLSSTLIVILVSTKNIFIAFWSKNDHKNSNFTTRRDVYHTWRHHGNRHLMTNGNIHLRDDLDTDPRCSVLHCRRHLVF